MPMFRLQRATQPPPRYAPPHDALRAPPRRRGGGAAGGAAGGDAGGDADPLCDWRLNKLLGIYVEASSAEMPQLQQRMQFTASLSYKPVAVARWTHHSVVHTEETFTFEDLKQDDELAELFLGSLWEFVRESYVEHATPHGMEERLGPRAPERLPPMSELQRIRQQMAFDHTQAMIEAQLLAEEEEEEEEAGAGV